MKLQLLLMTALTCRIAGAQNFPIAGVIVNAQSGSPIRRARIVVTDPESPSRALSTVTGEDGHFSFAVLQGKYSLMAELGGVRQPFGLGGPGQGAGVGIVTGPDRDTSHLVFRWFLPGVITGTVIDDHGEPVQSALVQLLRSSAPAGRKRTATARWFWTDDRGVYRFAPLIGGTYYLAVTGVPWYSDRKNRMMVAGETPEPSPAYAPTYYPGGSDFLSAKPVLLLPGGEVRADFTLRTVSGVNVQVKCSNTDGRSGRLNLISEELEGVEGFQRTLNFYGGSATLPGVPPGRYVVRLSGNGDKPFSVRKTVDVSTMDVTVDLALQPPPSVSGRVTFANPSTRPKSTVYVRLHNDANGVRFSRALDQDGGFEFSYVTVAKYRPQIWGGDGFFVAQLSATGASVKDGVIDVEDGATVALKILASDDAGIVKGFVMNDKSPVPGVQAVLAPRRQSTDPGDYHSYQTDSDGSFEFKNVRSGDYVLFAVSQLDLEYANPVAVRPYLSSGRPVRVTRQATISENISVSPPPPHD